MLFACFQIYAGDQTRDLYLDQEESLRKRDIGRGEQRKEVQGREGLCVENLTKAGINEIPKK